MYLFIHPSSTLDSSCLMRRCRHDREMSPRGSVLCISRGNCRQTTFVIFFMSKVGNLWNGIPSGLDSFHFGAEHQISCTCYLLCCSLWDCYTSNLSLWQYVHGWLLMDLCDAPCDLFLTTHLRPLNYLVTLDLCLLWMCIVSVHCIWQKSQQTSGT